MMKYIIALVVLVSSMSVHASNPLTCETGLQCTGGPTVGFNATTKQLEFIPQCFPWVWLSDYQKGNILDMYKNQDACRAKRFIDFGI